MRTSANRHLLYLRKLLHFVILANNLASLSQSRPVRERRENSAFLQRMYTDYRSGHLSRKEYLQRISYRFCPPCMFYGTCHDVEIVLIFFAHCHSFCFKVWIAFILHAYVRFRNNISMRFHATILCVFECEKMRFALS